MTSTEDYDSRATHAIKEALYRHGYIIGTLSGIDKYAFHSYSDEAALEGLLSDMVNCGDLAFIDGLYRLTDTGRETFQRQELAELFAGTIFEDEPELVIRLLS